MIRSAAITARQPDEDRLRHADPHFRQQLYGRHYAQRRPAQHRRAERYRRSNLPPCRQLTLGSGTLQYTGAGDTSQSLRDLHRQHHAPGGRPGRQPQLPAASSHGSTLYKSGQGTLTFSEKAATTNQFVPTVQQGTVVMGNGSNAVRRLGDVSPGADAAIRQRRPPAAINSLSASIT